METLHSRKVERREMGQLQGLEVRTHVMLRIMEPERQIMADGVTGPLGTSILALTAQGFHASPLSE